MIPTKTQSEAHIAGVGVATPYAVSTEQLLKIDREAREFCDQPEEAITAFSKFVKGSGIHNRYYVHPMWTKGLPQWDNLDGMDKNDIPPGALRTDIFTPSNYRPPFYKRMTVFEDTCVKLGITAAKRALEDWGGNLQDVSHIITTCTSGWREPGIACCIIKELGLSLDCAKAELNFNGCFCGATCLRMGRDVIRSGNAGAVLIVAVEVASTHFDFTTVDKSDLVACSLFADGAAAIVLANEGMWRYAETGMSLIPDSMDILGLRPPTGPGEQGYKMHLDPRVGKKLGQYFQQKRGTELLTKLVADSTVLPALAIHPGGPRILENLKESFASFGWDANKALQPSLNTLQQFGNLGAAAMLFVLATTVKSFEEDEIITMAFGPGVTIEWAKLVRANIPATLCAPSAV